MKKIFTLLFIGFCLIGFAQNSKLRNANKKYENYSYIDAIEIYEKVAEKGHKSADLFKKLGNSYYFNAELDKASKWYKELFQLQETVEPEYYYRYSQCLKAEEKYDEADKYFNDFVLKSGDPSLNNLMSNSNYLEDINAISGKYTVNSVAFNSEYADFSPSFFGNELVITSARKEGALHKKIHSWTKQNFTDLYLVIKDNEGNYSEVQNFSKEINTPYNESSAVFTKDGKTMYFTRNNFNNGKKGKDEEKTMLLKIYKASLENGIWTNIVELPFNNDNYQVAHPALSSDEKTLYFVSDMPGGFGSSDIYKVSILADGTFGTPENLGNTINTKARESFPFVNHNQVLYFASDGHLGLGGFDVFEISLGEKNAKPVNLGKPINSSTDDFGFIINTKNEGYFASNRSGGQGFDDIYKFTKCNQNLIGKVIDLKTNESIDNATVKLINSKNEVINQITSDKNGSFNFSCECNTNYKIFAEKPDYESNEKWVLTAKESGETNTEIALEKTVFDIEIGTDLAKIFDITLIYFDLDKWNIRDDAATDLQKIVEVMKQYPNMKIAIRSHTDSRQTHKYNEQLSDKRAKSTLEYLVKNGIDRNRLTAKGFGESQLVNECADGVSCSEEKHQQNRRSEFIVLQVK